MPRLNLLGGTYLARSIIANAQRCVNLYPEKNPSDASAPVTHQLTPGLTSKVSLGSSAPARGLYTATNGLLYYCAGNTLYLINSNFTLTALGTLASNSGIVYMQDNGNVLVLVDGTTSGYAVNLQTDIEGDIQSFVVENAGINATAGVYDVALKNTSGSGVGATFSIEILGGTIASISYDGDGSGYAVGNTGTFDGTIPGLTGSILKITAIGVAENTFGTINDPSFLGGTGIGYVDTFLVLSQPNSRNFYSSLSNITFAELCAGTQGQIQLGAISGGGTSVNPGTYTNVPLTGGNGSGAVATVVVTGGVVTSVSLTNVGSGYTSAPIISFTDATGSGAAAYATIGPSGSPFSGNVVTGIVLTAGGSNYTAPNVSITGGGGSNAAATAALSTAAVSQVTLTSFGSDYNAGDVLSAVLPTLSGFFYSVDQTNNFAFDPTYVAAKTGYPDLLSTLIVVHREIWLMGAFETTEVWYDAGGSLFPFQIMPGVFIQHGCIAPASVTTHDLDVFWLGLDNAGQGTVFMGTGYEARKISTWAIAQMISGYIKSAGKISDAIGFVYKQQDHVFYVLTFPTANATLVYDRSEDLWHERTWTDNNGNQNQVRYNCAAQAYGANVVADWQTGEVYTLDLGNYTDNGQPIVRYRTFPHILNDGKRQSYDWFEADMECGDGISASPTQQPLVQLFVSDDRGRTFYAAPQQTFGAQGDYIARPQWRQLGQCMDRVFALRWSDPAFTALQGAWISFTPAET